MFKKLVVLLIEPSGSLLLTPVDSQHGINVKHYYSTGVDVALVENYLFYHKSTFGQV